MIVRVAPAAALGPLRAASLLMLGVAASAIAAPAAAQDGFSVDASAGVGAATNPYLGSGRSPSTGSATVEVQPAYWTRDQLTELRLEGDALFTKYFKDVYPDNDSYSIRGTGKRKLGESSELTAELAYTNAVTGTFNGVDLPLSTGAPADLPVFVNDPVLGGIWNRRKSYQASAGYAANVSPRDGFSTGTSVSLQRYGGRLGLNEFNYVVQNASYKRFLSEQITVSADLQVSRTDYLRTRFGDATVYQPGVSVSRSFASGYSLTASGGVAIVKLAELGSNRTRASATFSVAACRKDTRWNACLNAYRATLPSSVQGVRIQTIGSASFSYRVNQNDTLSLQGSYSHSGAPLNTTVPAALVDGSLDYLSTTADYSHRFRQRLSGFATGTFAKVYDDSLRRSANAEIRIGVRYHLGAER